MYIVCAKEDMYTQGVHKILNFLFLIIHKSHCDVDLSAWYQTA